MAGLALVFPGQGSQVVGMGKALAESFPVAADLYERADDLLGFSFSQLCFEGPEAELNDTVNAQPALLVAGMAALRVLQEQFGSVLSPVAAAGHSVGEYPALVACGALTFDSALALVCERGRLMKQAGETAAGGMAAAIGAPLEAVEQLCWNIAAESGEVLQVANDNCPGQVVVAGSNAALDRFGQECKAVGVKIFKRLAVSVACHTELMRPAQVAFDLAVREAPLQDAGMPLCANTTAQFTTSTGELRNELQQQLCNTVQWRRSVQDMSAHGITHYIELGPGSVLQGLIRRVDASVVCTGFSEPAQLESVQELLD